MTRKYLSIRGRIATEPKMIYDKLSRKKALFFTIIFNNKLAKVVIKTEILIGALEGHLIKGDIVRVKGYEQFIKLYKGSSRFLVLNGRVIKILFSKYLLNSETLNEINAYKEVMELKQARGKTAEQRAETKIYMMKLLKAKAIKEYSEGAKITALAHLNLVRFIYLYDIPPRYQQAYEKECLELIENDLKQAKPQEITLKFSL